MSKIYLVVGTPGSGKTWVCKQLQDKFDYLAHDDYPNDKAYVSNILQLLDFATKPVLIETPFSVSQITEPLMREGYEVIPIFIIESHQVTAERYQQREGRPILAGHFTRINTYTKRAEELGAFKGTSQEVLDYLKKV